MIYYAKELKKQGAQNVLVSLGKDGALLVDEFNQTYYCPSAKGTLVNFVGRDDSRFFETLFYFFWIINFLICFITLTTHNGPYNF